MKYCTCRCFLNSNIFVKDLGLHVQYFERQQFLTDYAKALEEKGLTTEDQINNIIEKILKEINRRKNISFESKRRKDIIFNTYKPHHPHIYTLQEEYLDAKFLELVKICKQPNVQRSKVRQLVSTELADQVYSFPVFTDIFCKLFIEELESFESSDCPKGRPNSMNNYGILLDEIGFYDNFITPLRKDYLQHISAILYPDWTGEGLDSHKAFIVTYKPGQDIDLSYHFDNSEVTLNVSLGKQFTGSELYFGEMKSQVSKSILTTYKHSIGTGLLHRGQHMHGASSLGSGERYNLIIWMRSSDIRNQCCPMCNKRPDLVDSDGFADGFTQNVETVNVCNI